MRQILTSKIFRKSMILLMLTFGIFLVGSNTSAGVFVPCCSDCIVPPDDEAAQAAYCQNKCGAASGTCYDNCIISTTSCWTHCNPGC